jgi:hypothetical protein
MDNQIVEEESMTTHNLCIYNSLGFEAVGFPRKISLRFDLNNNLVTEG